MMPGIRGICALAAAVAIATAASGAVKTFKEGYIDKSLIDTSGEPQARTGKFWGYRSSKDGPGEDAFAKLMEKAKKEHIPVVFVWSNYDCIYCSRFAARLNEAKDEVSAKMKETPAMFAWFKGKGGKIHPLEEHGPKPCKDAYDFAVSHGAKAPWPFAVYYYCASDGEETAHAFSLQLMPPGRFAASAANFVKRCERLENSKRGTGQSVKR